MEAGKADRISKDWAVSYGGPSGEAEGPEPGEESPVGTQGPFNIVTMDAAFERAETWPQNPKKTKSKGEAKFVLKRDTI